MNMKCALVISCAVALLSGCDRKNDGGQDSLAAGRSVDAWNNNLIVAAKLRSFLDGWIYLNKAYPDSLDVAFYGKTGNRELGDFLRFIDPSSGIKYDMLYFKPVSKYDENRGQHELFAAWPAPNAEGRRVVILTDCRWYWVNESEFRQLTLGVDIGMAKKVGY